MAVNTLLKVKYQMCSIGPTSTNPKNVITAVFFTSSFPSFSITNCHTKKQLDAKILLI